MNNLELTDDYVTGGWKERDSGVPVPHTHGCWALTFISSHRLHGTNEK